MSWYDNVFLGAPDDEPKPEKISEPQEDWREPEDDDCDYWKSQCYGRA